jgi:hypothetical protein
MVAAQGSSLVPTIVGLVKGGQGEKTGVKVGMVIVRVSGKKLSKAKPPLTKLDDVVAVLNTARQSEPRLLLELLCPPAQTAPPPPPPEWAPEDENNKGLVVSERFQTPPPCKNTHCI